MSFERKGYVCRKPNGGQPNTGALGKKVYRDWFLVKARESDAGVVYLGNKLTLPGVYVGKRIRLKIEVLGGRD